MYSIILFKGNTYIDSEAFKLLCHRLQAQDVPLKYDDRVNAKHRAQ